MRFLERIEVIELKALYLVEARKSNVKLYESLNARKNRYFDYQEGKIKLDYKSESHELSKFYWNSPSWYFEDIEVFLDKMQDLDSKVFDSKIGNILKHIQKKNILPNYSIELLGYGHNSLPHIFITDGLRTLEARPILAGGQIQRLHIRFIVT